MPLLFQARVPTGAEVPWLLRMSPEWGAGHWIKVGSSGAAQLSHVSVPLGVERPTMMINQNHIQRVVFKPCVLSFSFSNGLFPQRPSYQEPEQVRMPRAQPLA